MGEPVDNGNYVETLLTECDLFTVKHYDVKQSVTLCTDEKSFNHILVVDGSGYINKKEFKKGDSFFVPANYGEYTINGKCEIIISKI